MYQFFSFVLNNNNCFLIIPRNQGSLILLRVKRKGAQFFLHEARFFCNIRGEKTQEINEIKYNRQNRTQKKEGLYVRDRLST